MHQNISDHLDASDDLLVRAWHDPAVTSGFATNSDDTLLYLTPILGPSSVLLMHRLTHYLTMGTPAGVILSRTDLAASLGTNPSNLAKVFNRLAQFGMIRTAPGGGIEVRTVIPPLPHKWLNRMPAILTNDCPYKA